VTRRLRSWWSGVWYLTVGAGTGFIAMLLFFALAIVAAMSLIGVGIPAMPVAITLLRRPLRFERRRAARRLGEPIPEPYRSGSPIRDPATLRDLGWLALHGVVGLFVGIFAFALPLGALRQLLTAAGWWLVPGGIPSSTAFQVNSWPSAGLCALTGVAMIALSFAAAPFADWQAKTAKALLGPRPGAKMTDRVVELAATRAAALEAHGAELRRIERELHDGAQARLSAVVLQIGIADQLFDRDPARARALLGKAQDAATAALAELRTVVRSIHPPLLTDRGLDGAVTALADRSAIACTVDVRSSARRPAAVEAAAYFIVAETLTNVTKHAHADQAWITLDGTADTLRIEIRDDGRGGADESRGSGLAGIRKRVEAFDGTVTLTSPPGGPTVLEVELPCGS
jgi:signal transduction histidine kinase